MGTLNNILGRGEFPPEGGTFFRGFILFPVTKLSHLSESFLFIGPFIFFFLPFYQVSNCYLSSIIFEL